MAQNMSIQLKTETNIEGFEWYKFNTQFFVK